MGRFVIPSLKAKPLNNLADDSSHDNVKLANNVDEPVTISRSYLVIALTHEDLSNYSDTIVIGTVKEMLPSRWNTIDGKEPDVDAESGFYSRNKTHCGIKKCSFYKLCLGACSSAWGSFVCKTKAGISFL
jgi:hypothetical protein